MIDVAQITGAQMLPSAEERQIGFGAPLSLGRLRVSRSARNEQRTFGGGAPTWTTRSSGPGPSRRTMGRKLPNKGQRSEEHTSELQSLMRISYAVFCLKKKSPHETLAPRRHTRMYNKLQQSHNNSKHTHCI